MDKNREGIRGRVALVIGHCAGMMDIVALPVWIGIVLIGQIGLDPQSAGGLATLFLSAVVASSLICAPRLNRIRRERVVPAAFTVAGLAFLSMTALASLGYGALAAAHAVAGLAVGCALSLTHGTMGGSANPHRLASISFAALGVVSLVFLATLPPLIERFGANAFFVTLAAIMFTAAVAALVGFPAGMAGAAAPAAAAESKLPRHVWFGMIGVSLLSVNQAMTFGFLERIGVGQGFTGAQVAAVLIGTGVVNLFPAVFAGLLQGKLSVARVMMIGPVLQGALGFTLSHAPSYAAYAVAASLFVSTLIFTHTFAFGFLAREDRSGRAVASTPVMVMTGAAFGPLLGGVLAQQLGYASLGWAALVIGLLSALSFSLAVRPAGFAKPVVSAA